METLLTFTAEILAIGFAALMIFDFVGGLLHLYHSSAPAATQETKKELEPQPQVVPGWDVIEPIGPSVATLSSIERNMPPAEVFSVEMPESDRSCQDWSTPNTGAHGTSQ